MKFKASQPRRVWPRLKVPPTVLAALWFGAQVVMLCLLFVFSDFLGNRYEVTGEDLLVPVGLNILTALLVAVAGYRLWRRDRLAGLVAVGLASLILTSGYEGRVAQLQPWLMAVLPVTNLRGAEGIVASLVFLGLIAAGSYWAGRGVAALAARSRWSTRELAGAVSVAIAGTFVCLVVPLSRNLLTEWPQLTYRPPRLEPAPVAAKTGPKPDIYYIVLDRYASQTVLREQFDYDNAAFADYLTSNHYYLNPSSRSNYPFTTMSVASTLSAGYLNEMIGRFGKAPLQTVIPFNETVRQAPVAQYLRDLGYRYTLIGNWYETSNRSPIADTIYQQTGRLTLFGADMTLNNFSKNVLTQSPLWRFIQPGLSLGSFKIFHYANLGDVDMTHYALQSLRDEVAKPAGGRFIFAHLLVPHDPYYFNADGSLSTNPSTDNVGRPVKQKYLGQVEFINAQMRDILSRIQQASGGQAVVIVQSDEGPYPNQLNDEQFDEAAVKDELKGGDMRNWSQANLHMKMGNLAAYYLPGLNWEEDPAAAGAADTVNIFRLVLNHYFGASLPYLPDCYYIYPDGRNRPMHFSDATTRLTGQPKDARCGSDGRARP